TPQATGSLAAPKTGRNFRPRAARFRQPAARIAPLARPSHCRGQLALFPRARLLPKRRTLRATRNRAPAILARRSIALVQSAAVLPPCRFWQRRRESARPALSAAFGPASTPDRAPPRVPPPRRNGPAGAGTRRGRVARRL